MGFLDFRSEFIALTWVRILVATTPKNESDIARVPAVLDAVAASATGRGHTVLAIETLILRTLVRNRLGDSDSAIVSLKRAIDLAEPEGIVQPIRDENDELEPMLRRALSGGGNRAFARALLSTPDVGNGKPIGPAGGNRLLVEPLSPRELEVLRHVRDGHTNQMIADTLFISLSTVKKHLNNLFGKLTAKNRTDALRRAHDFDLL